MSRPILKRTAITYERDIAALQRLRTAIVFDTSLETGRARAAIGDIEKCIRTLRELANSMSMSRVT